MSAPELTRSGLVIVDKPAGLTSHDVVARVRRLAGTRKVGHAGTLDPMATGVLVLGINRATRLLGYLAQSEKSYDATIRLGAATTTDDAEGEPVLLESASVRAASVAALTEDQVRAGLTEQVGEIQQVPSAVSAIKVNGKRAYARVRAGETVDLPARSVTVHAIDVRGFARDADYLDVKVSVRCSSGTYIRAIARDLGERLGVGGHLTALRRTAVGANTLVQSRTIDQLAEDFTLVSIATAARGAFPALDLSAEQAADVRVGRPLDIQLDALSAVFAPDGDFLALYEPRDGRARPAAVFVG